MRADQDPKSASAAAATRAGSPFGSLAEGPLTGHELKPALPLVFPDPVISRSSLPQGLQGDVIVEITIDEQGNVIKLELLHGLGYGIDEKVLATLRNWRFRPATLDGVAIASQQDYHVHFPS